MEHLPAHPKKRAQKALVSVVISGISVPVVFLELFGPFNPFIPSRINDAILLVGIALAGYGIHAGRAVLEDSKMTNEKTGVGYARSAMILGGFIAVIIGLSLILNNLESVFYFLCRGGGCF